MKEIVVTENRKLSVNDCEIPECAEKEVLVRVDFSGLCGSDIPRIFHNGAHFYPVRLGHEFSGVITKTGSKVEKLQVGNRISCIPLIPNRSTKEYRYGYPSLGKGYSFIGSRKAGGNAEYVTLPEECCFLLPEDVSSLEGAFFEPVTVGIHPILMAGGCKDKNVVILGVGTIGLLAMQSAIALGAKTITAVDIDQKKLDLAKQLGADFTIKSDQINNAEVKTILEENSFDQLILETAGVPQTFLLALEIAGPRAQLALIGTIHKDFNLSWKEYDSILRKEITIAGSWMNYSSPFPGEEWIIAAELFKQKKICIHPLIDCIVQAPDYIKKVLELDGGPANGKIMLNWGRYDETHN